MKIISSALLILTISLLSATSVHSARILGLFQFPVRSQHVLGSFLLKELAKRGHDVTMVSPFPLDKPIVNYTDVKIDNGLSTYMKNIFGPTIKDKPMNILQKLTSSSQVFLDFQRLYLESPELKEFLKSEVKFDVVIQLYCLNEAMFAIGHHFNAPTIAFCSVGASSKSNQLFANPAPYSMVANVFTSSTETFYERLVNTVAGFGYEMIQQFKSRPFQEQLLKEHFPNAPHLQELMDNVNIALMNSHPAVEGSKPYMPNMIQIGGFYMQEPEKLPKDIQASILTFLDDADEYGAILFSFGSAVQGTAFDREKLKVLLRVFGRLKQRVIFKWDSMLDNPPKNMLASSWLPQTGILGHKNTKLFVTHAGLGGVAESIFYAVPAVCIPFFGDQHKNCDDMVKNGYAVRMDITDLSENLLYETMQSVLNNSKYKNKLLAASDFYRSQPMHPLETAIYWIEHVIKHKGANHFPKNIGTKQTLYEYLLLDIVAFFLVIMFLIYVILRKIFRIVYQRLFYKRNSKHKTTMNKSSKSKKEM